MSMQMRCRLKFAFVLHSHQGKLPTFLALHANLHSHHITSPGANLNIIQLENDVLQKRFIMLL
jgi:hypothetical protein